MLGLKLEVTEHTEQITAQSWYGAPSKLMNVPISLIIINSLPAIIAAGHSKNK